MAFDGDRPVLDHSGDFISGEYVVGLLAGVFLNKEKGAVIIHDPRVIWNTIDVVGKCVGKAVASKTGHAFQSRDERDVIYGGKCRLITTLGFCLL